MNIPAINQRMAELAFKKVTGQLSAEEATELNLLIESSEENELLFEKLMNAEETAENVRVMSEFDVDAGWQLVEKSFHFKKKKFGFYRGLIAATFFVVIGLVSFFILRQKQKHILAETAKKATFNGDTIAIIKPSNGPSIVIGENKRGTIRVVGEKLFKYSSDIIIFPPVKKLGNYTIGTLPGKALHVQLSDGTNVWINGNSTLSFPLFFSTTERRAVLHGEAYFEVTKDSSNPFRVTTGNMEVRVLGTKFSIRGYGPNDPIKTSLLEGIVQLKSQDSVIKLQKGEEAVLANGTFQKGKLQQSSVNNVTGLKEGVFRFENEDIKTILDELAYSFDFTVEYRGPVPEKTYSAYFSRTTPISEIVANLGQGMKINIRLVGKHILVDSTNPR